MEGLINPGGAPMGQVDDEIVKNSSIETFVADVIEPSMTVPVLVDFWATWCSPCKLLGPTLEKAIRAAGGKVKLVKIDIDRNPELAQQLRIQSVPTIYVFKDGKVVDGFTGAVPESELKAFIARFIGEEAEGDGIEEALDQAASFIDEGDAETALEIYKEVLAQDNANPKAFGGLLRAMIVLGQKDEAQDILNRLPADIVAHPDVIRQKNALDLAGEAEKLGPLADLEKKLQDNPDDHQARFDLAVANFAAGGQKEALDLLLELFRRDRQWNGEAAKKQILQFFETLGPADPLTIASRKRFSSLMFS